MAVYVYEILPHPDPNPDYNDPNDLVKNLSKDVVDAIYMLTFPKNKFRKKLFPVEDRWKFIKSVELTESTMKFVMENKSELTKFRTVLAPYRFVNSTGNYAENAGIMLGRKWQRKIFKGVKGYYIFHDIEVVYQSVKNDKGEKIDQYYFAKAKYTFYPTIELYSGTVPEDLIDLVTSKVATSGGLIALDKIFNLDKVNFKRLFKDRYPQLSISGTAFDEVGKIMRVNISWKDAYIDMISLEDHMRKKISINGVTEIDSRFLSTRARTGAMILIESGYSTKIYDFYADQLSRET